MLKETIKKNDTYSGQGSTLSGWWKKVFLAVFVAGSFFLGMYLDFFFHNELCHGDYEYINRDNACLDKVIDKRGYIELKRELEEYFGLEGKAGRITHASVYFRDLNAGPAFGIKENETYSSASLLKLPVAIAVLKEVEDDPTLLYQLFQVSDQSSVLEQFFSPSKSLEMGQSYTMQQLLEHSLIYSDNTANKIIKDYLYTRMGDNSIVITALKDLGLILPQSYEDEEITVRAYASLFRLLYNSSYLNPQYSELLLSILVRSEFMAGLRAGVPDGILVAHKFGERYIGDTKQLHDCGIIYYPDNPYLLCVMTQGDDFQELTKIIGTVSEMFYNEVNSRRLD